MHRLSPKNLLPYSNWLKLSYISNAMFLVAQFLLVLLPSDRDPVSDFVSEYIYSNLWWLFLAGLIFQLLTAFFQAHVLFYFVNRLKGIVMAIWGISILGIAIFPTDPGGIPVTLTGYLHAIFVFIGLISFTSVCWGLASQQEDVLVKQLIFSFITIFILFLLSVPLGYVGVTERGLLLIVFVLHMVIVGTISKIIEGNNTNN